MYFTPQMNFQQPFYLYGDGSYFPYPYPGMFYGGIQGLNPMTYYFGQPMPEVPRESMDVSLANIYTRGIVNHVIGAFFIQEEQEKEKEKELLEKKNLEKNEEEEKKLIQEEKGIKLDENEEMKPDANDENKEEVKTEIKQEEKADDEGKAEDKPAVEPDKEVKKEEPQIVVKDDVKVE